jgi:ubiquinone/menaquinone biosynthesis C-methylase UbiE
MKESVNQQSAYALGHSEQELERLSRQGRMFEPFTRQLFEQAGISAGMRVLDVGCGAGDVAFLAAALVGPGGEVIGVDRAAEAVRSATARAQAGGIGNVKFLEGDPAEMQFDRQFDRPFDAVVGRLVLMFYPDPVDAVRKLAGHLREGGLIIFQEFDMANARSLPVSPTFERQFGWIRQTLNATGVRTEQGLEMYSVFVAAGLPGPSMRMDALVGGGPDSPSYELAAEVVRSLLPAMEKFNIATAAEVDIATLAQRVRDEVVGAKGVALSPALIGSWARRAA